MLDTVVERNPGLKKPTLCQQMSVCAKSLFSAVLKSANNLSREY